MEKLEARIRVSYNDDKISHFEVALANIWHRDGCFDAREAYSIFYDATNQNGKIVEVNYRGGPYQFILKTPHEKAPWVNIPQSIVNTAFQDYDEIPDDRKDELTGDEIELSILRCWDFKPLSEKDFIYIKNNCFRSEH